MKKEDLISLFETDEDLLNIYHIMAPSTSEICAERTLQDLKDSVVINFEKDGKLIGYYGINKTCLNGFFLIPEYRNKETICQLWEQIEMNFTKDYYCGLYNKNTRAIEFIRKKSIQEFPIETQSGIFFKIKR